MNSTAPAHSQSVLGSQTLARGLLALEHIAEAPEGLTGIEVAKVLKVHQSIAYRVLQTLVQFRLVRRDLDGRYRVGLGVLGLAHSARSGLRSPALPILRRLSHQTQASAWLFMEEGDDAVALLAIEPSVYGYMNRFLEGSRHPVTRGAAGYALLSLRAPSAEDPEPVVEARQQGYAVSHGEVVVGAWAAAVPLNVSLLGARMCINLTSSREDVVRSSIQQLLGAAAEVMEAVERDA